VLGVLGFPSFTIARPLDNPYVDRFLNEFRGLTGQYILSKDGGAAEAQQVLARGGILALLADQHAGRKGCWVEFFGRPASSHKGIALFTLASEAPTMFCYARRTGGPLVHKMGTDEVLEPRTMPAEMRTVSGITEWYTRKLEDTIRQAPEQYWWLHRRWREQPPAKGKRKPDASRPQAA
jgi:KDO2-lipid IV(A) lauroyltransferase